MGNNQEERVTPFLCWTVVSWLHSIHFDAREFSFNILLFMQPNIVQYSEIGGGTVVAMKELLEQLE